MMAQLTSLLINCFSAFGGSKQKQVSAVDFIPKWGEKSKEISKKEQGQSVEEQKAILQSIMGGIKPKTKRREIK
jgi:hypothetical protein